MINTVMTDRGPVPDYYRTASCSDCGMLIHQNNPQHVRCRACQRHHRNRCAALRMKSHRNSTPKAVIVREKHPTIVDHILGVLADGRPRLTSEIAQEVIEKYPCTFDAVQVAISKRIAHDRRFERTRKGRVFVYRFIGRAA